MPANMRRVAVISTASGNGKTTVGRALAEKLGVLAPFPVVRLRSTAEVELFVRSAERAA